MGHGPLAAAGLAGHAGLVAVKDQQMAGRVSHRHSDCGIMAPYSSDPGPREEGLDEKPQQEFARDLGFLDAYTIGVGTMIGAGIFILPSIAAANAGPASMVSFAVGGFVSLLAALSLSELATGMPLAGGSYHYVNRALGGFFGSIVGWGMWAGLMFATAFYMIGFGQYLTFFWGEMPVAAAALAMAAFLAWVNYRGVKETAALQNFIVVALMGFIVVFVAVGVFRVDYDVLRPFNPHGWGAVTATAATVYVTFIGFEVIATSAEEIKNPGRNLPLAMIASVLTPTALYVLVMLVSTGVLPLEALAASRIPVADVARTFLGPLGALMMVVGAVLATVSSANASILSAARVNFAMGRDRILSEWLNEIHPSLRTPYRAIGITGVLVLLLIGVGVGVETLADVASFSFLLTYALVHVAVIVLRRAEPEDYDPDFRLPGLLYPTIPVLGILSCLAVMASMRPMILGLGTGIALAGVGWWGLYSRTRAREPSLVGEAILAPRERRAPEGERHRVVVAVANPATQGHLLKLAAACAREHENPEMVAVNVIEVPPQTALDQQVRFEEQRVRMQQELLDASRNAAEGLGMGIRTRAVIGRSIGVSLNRVAEEEDAAQLFLGWHGEVRRTQHILGHIIDPVVRDAPCEVVLLHLVDAPTERVVTLVGEGPHAPVAVQRARAIARVEGVPLVLVNVQPPGEGAEEEGYALIRGVAKAVGLGAEDYQPRVVPGADVAQAALEMLGIQDLVVVGATRSTRLTQTLFGSIPERIGERFQGPMAIVGHPEYRPRTLVRAVVERLGGKIYEAPRD